MIILDYSKKHHRQIILAAARALKRGKIVAYPTDTCYGLAAGVWTQDIKRALRVASAVKAGNVWINTYNLYDPDQPFGGMKSSGFGRELGAAAVEQYTELKSMWIDLT